MNDVDPQAWLADVLARIANHPARSLDDLLPWNWTAAAALTGAAERLRLIDVILRPVRSRGPRRMLTFGTAVVGTSRIFALDQSAIFARKQIACGRAPCPPGAASVSAWSQC